MADRDLSRYRIMASYILMGSKPYTVSESVGTTG